MKRLNEIRHYIIANFTGTYLEEKYGDNDFNESEKELLVEGLNNFFWVEYMNLCDCGNPELCQEAIKQYLQILKNWTESDDKRCLEIKEKEFQDIFNVKSIYDNPSLLFLAYVLDSCGFTDHGSSIGGAWITDLGRMYLDVLNEVNFTD